MLMQFRRADRKMTEREECVEQSVGVGVYRYIYRVEGVEIFILDYASSK